MSSLEDTVLDEIVQKLPEYKKYDELYKKGNKTVSNYCESICNDGNLCKETKELCNTIIDKLKKFEDKDKTDINDKDNCSYFIYWTLDKIIEKFRSKCSKKFEACDETKLNGELLRAYKDILNKSCIFYFDGKFDEWKEEKYLYYYIKSYEHFNNKKEFVSGEKQKYCKYLKYIESIYEKHMKQCCTYFYEQGYQRNICSYYFKCDKNYTPYKILSKLKCGNVRSSEYWEDLIKELTIDRAIKDKSQDILKSSFNMFIEDPFYKITHSVKNKNKDKFLDPDGYLEKYYSAEHRNMNWRGNKIRLSYYAV
ncbi:PIR Superfamily Protein [Plasmodium malariae]|uniref:PIR Superfamily Protein n=1 Tax=Plasmodium malariae TaxID=5858 RepID=A0A1A8X4J7_PLAMA|nr:PIR Superfamily Protein [Plasmodium malariae]